MADLIRGPPSLGLVRTQFPLQPLQLVHFHLVLLLQRLETPLQVTPEIVLFPARSGRKLDILDNHSHLYADDHLWTVLGFPV